MAYENDIKLAPTPTMSAFIERCLREPFHVRRKLEEPLGSGGQAALSILHTRALALMEALEAELQIPWLEHVCDYIYEHFVLPKPLYEHYKQQFDEAGFKQAPYERQLACADGLEEAIRRGGVIGQQIH